LCITQEYKSHVTRSVIISRIIVFIKRLCKNYIWREIQIWREIRISRILVSCKPLRILFYFIRLCFPDTILLLITSSSSHGTVSRQAIFYCKNFYFWNAAGHNTRHLRFRPTGVAVHAAEADVDLTRALIFKLPINYVPTSKHELAAFFQNLRISGLHHAPGKFF